MKKQNFLVVFSLIIYLSGFLFPQSSTFSVEAYKQFMSTHQNMNAGQLLQLHNTGTFLNQIPAQTQTVLFNRIIVLNLNM